MNKKYFVYGNAKQFELSDNFIWKERPSTCNDPQNHDECKYKIYKENNNCKVKTPK